MSERVFEGILMDDDVCVWLRLSDWYDTLDALRTIEKIADAPETKALMEKLHKEIREQVFEYIRVSAMLEQDTHEQLEDSPFYTGMRNNL